MKHNLLKFEGRILVVAILVDGGLNLKWADFGSDDTSPSLGDESFRAAIKR
jgi:hypothetical protein